MSMLSSQVDELRELATRYYELQVGAVKAVKMPSNMGSILREAADTIWELCDDLQRAHRENAKLRESLERAAGIIADICGECPVSRYEWLSSDGCAEKCGTVTEEECWIAYLAGKRWDESGAEVDR